MSASDATRGVYILLKLLRIYWKHTNKGKYFPNTAQRLWSYLNSPGEHLGVSRITNSPPPPLLSPLLQQDICLHMSCASRLVQITSRHVAGPVAKADYGKPRSFHANRFRKRFSRVIIHRKGTQGSRQEGTQPRRQPSES